jgi:hypothetical protein
MVGIAKIIFKVFDGTRQLIEPTVKLLVNLRNGHQNQVPCGSHFGPSVKFDVDFF